MKENDREQELIAKKKERRGSRKREPRQGQKGGERALNNVVNRIESVFEKGDEPIPNNAVRQVSGRANESFRKELECSKN